MITEAMRNRKTSQQYYIILQQLQKLRKFKCF